jgi:hypothetical protein
MVGLNCENRANRLFIGEVYLKKKKSFKKIENYLVSPCAVLL